MILVPVAGETLGSKVYERLRTYILSGGARPGDRLTEIELSKRLGVSRGPLREAILRLTEEGLLVRQPYKGVRVRPLSRREVEELYSLRTNFESFAFREAWDKRDAAARADLIARFDHLAEARAHSNQAIVIDAELAFHSWVFEVSAHTLLQSSWAHLVPLVKLYLSVHQGLFGTRGTFSDANARYMELACQDDLDAMLDHLHDHMKMGLAEVTGGLS